MPVTGQVVRHSTTPEVINEEKPNQWAGWTIGDAVSNLQIIPKVIDALPELRDYDPGHPFTVYVSCLTPRHSEPKRRCDDIAFKTVATGIGRDIFLSGPSFKIVVIHPNHSQTVPWQFARPQN